MVLPLLATQILWIILVTDYLANARTADFTVLVLAQLFNCFNAQIGDLQRVQALVRHPLALVAPAGSLVCRSASSISASSTQRSARLP
jgi:hypothetical protein